MKKEKCMKKCAGIVAMFLLILSGCSVENRIKEVGTNKYEITAKKMSRSSLRSDKNKIVIGKDTIPGGIYKITFPEETQDRQYIDVEFDQANLSDIKGKDYKSIDSSILRKLFNRSYFSSDASSFTTYLPDGSQLEVISDKRKTPITFEKVDKFEEITELSKEKLGVFKVPNKQKELEVELTNNRNSFEYEGSAEIYTYDKINCYKYEIYGDSYIKSKMVLDSGYLTEESKETYYLNESLDKGESLKIKLLDQTFVENE